MPNVGRTPIESLATHTARYLLTRADVKPPKPACGSGSTSHTYNTPIHVFALFLILVLSILACSFPIAARRFPGLPVPHRALFLSRHFGTGVLLATAFVHLLPTAYTSLTDPCLPSFWNERYPAMAGLIAMLSMFVVVGIEMFFATKGAGHSHAVAFEVETTHDGHEAVASGPSSTTGVPRGHVRPPSWKKRFREDRGTRRSESRERLVDKTEAETMADGGRQNGAVNIGEDDADDLDIDMDELDSHHDRHTNGYSTAARMSSDNAKLRVDTGSSAPMAVSPGTSFLTEEQQQQKALLQCLLLEAGILFHSIFIGMAVSVATGASFVVLLIAISFHQTFEGLALGSRIAGITAFPRNSPKPWLMALAYGGTTPLGQAIGLFVHNLYDPYSQTGLLMVGVMNAISSGLLLFAGLVELLAEDLLSDHSYETLQGARRLEACGAVIGGAMLMALVGAWA